MKILGLLVLLFTFTQPALSFYELDGEFAYDKQLYGTERNNKSVSRSYYASFASYFLTLTALEFNYSTTKDIDTRSDEYKLTGTDYTLTSEQAIIESYSYGIGLRQAFANKNSFLVPTLSLGYARQITTYSTDYTYRNDLDSSTLFIQGDKKKQRQDSIFGTFSLKIQLTKNLSLKGSVKTLFPADDFNKAKDYLKYTAGFSWMFQ